MTLFIILFHIVACLTLILVVLLQAGSESGLSGTLGGGSGESIFGAKSSSFLTKFTTGMAILFMVSSLTLAIAYAKKDKSLMLKVEEKQPVGKEHVPSESETQAPAKTVETTEATEPVTAETAKVTEPIAEEQKPETPIS